jgi:hypothetical protein
MDNSFNLNALWGQGKQQADLTGCPSTIPVGGKKYENYSN